MIAKPTIQQQPFPDLGPYCSYRDATYSASANAVGITDNTPTAAQYKAMQYTYNTIIKPVFDHFGPGEINSFFRGDKLQLIPGTKRLTSVNAIVGGSPTSNHIWGGAVDIDYDNVPGVENIEVFDWVRENRPFYELISENPAPVTNDPRWVHVAANAANPNRKRVKRMIIVKGKKVHQTWPWDWK